MKLSEKARRELEAEGQDLSMEGQVEEDNDLTQFGITQEELDARQAEYETPVEPAFNQYARDPELISSCDECSGSGRINEKYEYDPEIGDRITDFEYCKCEAGIKEEQEDRAYEDRAAVAEEAHYQRRFEERGGYEIRF